MFDKIIEYCKNEPFHAIVVAALIVLAVIIAIAIIVVSSKKESADKGTAQPENLLPENKETEAKQPIEVEEKIERPIEVQSEKPEEKIEPIEVQPEKTEEKIEPIEVQPAPIVEENAESVKTEDKVPVAKNDAVVTKKPKKVKETAMLHDEFKDANTELDFYEEDISDQVARYRGKWVVCRIITEDNASEETYFFELHASNGEKLLSSEEYTTYNGAIRGIETHKNNILRGNFRITLSKKGDYIFKLLNGKNMLLCLGEHYATRARCEAAIESTKRFAKTAFVDENIQDYVVKVPVEDDKNVQPLPDGYNGKWVIDCKTSDDGEKVYFFELFANNGERLLSSEEYTTYIGAVNGIHTHKTNIDKGNFRISLTKHGDYIYKLLNSNGQLLCLGEHYKTKRLCQNAVESVKRFAINSPLLTDPSLTK